MTKAEFQILFKRLYNPLCNYANSILSNYDQAEDVVQDVLYDFWQKQETSEVNQDKIDHYLIRAVKYKCINIHRKSLVEKEYQTEVFHTNSDYYNNDDEAVDYKAILYRAIGQLPEKTKQVFLMSKVEGLKYQEIAENLNISLKTVENQMGRAFKHLRLILKNEKLFQFLLFFLTTQ
jgi:RNA polymerase sigma-70 factor (ECF subfamily)